ncbi:MAG: hypothetical protein NVSMB2_22860 [Chloroflexota bacterium]
MTTLRLSVVTPSFEQGAFIERTIQSVLTQEQPPDEYVIVDALSTDVTELILARYAASITSVREPDRGQADAVNKGIGSTSGEIIGWLNSDDMYRPGTLKAMREVFESRPDVDVVYGDADLIDENDAVVGRYYTEAWNHGRLLERCFLAQPAVFFRRGVIDRYGSLDSDLHYCMDYDYWLRLAEGGARFLYVPRVLAASRLHPAAKTLRARRAVHAEINTMLRRRVGRVPDTWLMNEAHTLVELDPPGYLPFALAVVIEALRLSREWNQGFVSFSLLVRLLGPIATAVAQRARHVLLGHRSGRRRDVSPVRH